MTLLVRDEVDVVASQLDYHLAAGVDFVVAMDHNSVDGTAEVLRDYEQRGLLRLVPAPDEDLYAKQGEWVSIMARLAACEHGADWVINADADEFWYPRRGSLKEVFEAVPPTFGAIRSLMRPFVPRPDGPEPLFERMVVRHRCQVERTSPYHFQVKVAHRAVPDVNVAPGNHDAYGSGLRLLRPWIPIEVLHFPLRSGDQMERKYRRGSVFKSAHAYAVVDSFAAGGVEDVWSGFIVDEERLQRELASGEVAIDIRLRDALRVAQPGGARLDVYDALAESAFEAERAFVADAALFMETDAAVQLNLRSADLETRVSQWGAVRRRRAAR